MFYTRHNEDKVTATKTLAHNSTAK